VVTRVCVSVCLSAAACLHYCTHPDVTWRSGKGCPLVVHYWADLQSVHGSRCYGNITQTRNVSEYMLVLAQCIVWYFIHLTNLTIFDAIHRHATRRLTIEVQTCTAISAAYVAASAAATTSQHAVGYL